MLCGKKIVAVIQARMGSSRLPGKTLAEIRGKPLLEWIILRVKQAKTVDEIVLATSGLGRDDEVARLAHQLGCQIYRGEEKDVLNRVFEAALAANADVVVRVCADNPFLDEKTLDECATAVACQGFDYATNSYSGGAPPGTVSEAISFTALREAHLQAKAGGEREHVTPYVRTKPHVYKNASVPTPSWLARGVRLCIDTPQDLEFVRKIYSKLSAKELLSQEGLKKAVQLAEKMQPPAIVFLTEARRERGIGHLMRCIAVASQMRKTQPERKIIFLLNEGVGRQLVEKAGFEVRAVKFDAIGKPNAQECTRVFSLIGPSTVVTDIFLLDSKISQACIPGGNRIIAVDDVGGRKMHGHAIVNPTVVSEWYKYEKNSEFPRQQLFAGAQYLPLKPEVLKLKGKFKLGTKASRILVTMGGGDEFHKTLTACNALEKFLKHHSSSLGKITVTVVRGAAFDAKLKSSLARLCAGNRSFKLVDNPSNLPQLLCQSDIAITAGGVTSYEAAFLGVPQIILPRTIEYESKAATQFQARGAALTALDGKQLETCLSKALPLAARRKMSVAGRKIVDGKGAQRIAQIMLGK